MKTKPLIVAPGNTPSEQFAETKLKLKNAHLPSLKAYIDKKEASVSRKLASLIGKTTDVPVMVAALAELHGEAKYSRNGAPLAPKIPECPFKAAKAYVELKELEVNPYPGKPLPKRSSSSSSSSTSSLSSGKSVKWAEQLTEVRIID